MTGRAQVAQAMSERDLDQGIRALADEFRLRRYHTFDSRKSEPGFPDLVLVGPGGVLFRELKRQDGHPTQAQLGWITGLQDAGADAKAWRPSDLLDGTIARELAAIAGIRVADVSTR